MAKYKFNIINTGKLYRNIFIAIACSALCFSGMSDFFHMYSKSHILLCFAISYGIPLVLFFLWIYFVKKEDVFEITSQGIQTLNHGTIEWRKIKICSWECYWGKHILLILKSFKKYHISTVHIKGQTVNDRELEEFFEEIKQCQSMLPDVDKFRMDEDRFHRFEIIFILVYAFTVIIAMAILKYFRP